MNATYPSDKNRKRALSKRAFQTRERVFDAAETVFAKRGYDGATIRDIASEAQEPVGTIHHHGGGKHALFGKVIARRAETLSNARLVALEYAKDGHTLTLAPVLEAFIRPFFELAAQDGRWHNYARLVAHVSADDRWTEIAAQQFDPTAQVFVEELQSLLPEIPHQKVVEGFVFTVSAMLALLTSDKRISDLGGDASDQGQVDHLVAFCAAGFASQKLK